MNFNPKHFLWDEKDGIGTVTLNRPERKNPLTFESYAELRDAFRALPEKKGIKVKVMNLSTIKPLDEEAVVKLAKETRAIITVEEHQIAGGMGSAVSECLAKYYPIPIEFIGVQNKFGQSGTPAELVEHYEMGVSHIIKAVEKILTRR